MEKFAYEIQAAVNVFKETSEEVTKKMVVFLYSIFAER